ncbi:hypothetical protein EDD15DRAFT_2316093 [Pisolithus albus]|nr:hypothetical protein EDD15DRAFT_2316093 [Pisolithus albus]
MPASISPLALLVPRPQVPSTPAGHRVSGLSSLPRTPQRSPVASHIFISPPSVHRNSTDSWNSSNYDMEDPAAAWKDEEVRLLSRTLDALPAHLITPFNGPVPPSNLLDKVARGISAAKGPNDWPHTIRATRIKLLELARVKAREERYANIHEEVDDMTCSTSANKSEKPSRTPDPLEVLQQRTNTPLGVRRPLYRQSSMDFMSPVGLDKHESITRLSSRFQRHDRTLHHPYHRPAHLRRRSEHANARNVSPSTPSSSTLNSNNLSHLRKSTASATSASTSSFGSPMSHCAPLRPSSLRRASTATLTSTSDAHEDSTQGAVERTKTYGESKVLSPDPVVRATPSKSKMPANTRSSKKPRVSGVTKKAHLTCPAVDGHTIPRTPPPEARAATEEKSTSISAASPANARKVRKGHKPQLSLSSDEEYQERSKTAKKLRTREPSWTALLASPLPAQPLFVSPYHAAGRPKLPSTGGTESSRRAITGRSSEAWTSDSSRISTDNDLSTGSTDTAATSVSSAPPVKHKTPKSDVRTRVQSPNEKKPVRRNPTRNPSMFGPELPNPQRTPESPARIPLSSPRVISLPASPASPLPVYTSSNVYTLAVALRAARRIEFNNTSGNTMLGSAIQLG